MTSKPSQPSRASPPAQWEHLALYHRVRETLTSLPIYFKSETFIEGIFAVDIFTLNTVLGAAIENQVVTTLNQLRAFWDPDEKYPMHRFVRQSQTFPDVLLRKVSADSSSRNDNDIVMGIELKGWYLLAKEAEPSFRFVTTPSACAPADLVVIVPWSLSNVISGSPRVFTPFLENAKYAAEYRNYHWKCLRETKSDPSITSPKNVSPYPIKSDQITDTAVSDGGRNFGRFARTGIMDDFLARAKLESLCGIAAEHWLAFFKIFQDQKDNQRVLKEIALLRSRITANRTPEVDAKIEAIDLIIAGVRSLLE